MCVHVYDALFALTQLNKCGFWSLTGWPSLAYCIDRWAVITVRRQAITALNVSFHVGGPLTAEGLRPVPHGSHS